MSPDCGVFLLVCGLSPLEDCNCAQSADTGMFWSRTETAWPSQKDALCTKLILLSNTEHLGNAHQDRMSKESHQKCTS